MKVLYTVTCGVRWKRYSATKDLEVSDRRVVGLEAESTSVGDMLLFGDGPRRLALLGGKLSQQQKKHKHKHKRKKLPRTNSVGFS